MSYAPSNPSSKPREPLAESDRPVANRYASDEPHRPDSEREHPRLIEEHHVLGPHGEDEIEATDEQGRRWYHLRPEPRRRADFIGLNYTWWIFLWLLFIVLMAGGLGGGHGWGY